MVHPLIVTGLKVAFSMVHTIIWISYFLKKIYKKPLVYFVKYTHMHLIYTLGTYIISQQ